MEEKESILFSESSQSATPSPLPGPKNIPTIPPRSSRYKLIVTIVASLTLVLLIVGVVSYIILNKMTFKEAANKLEASISPSPSIVSQKVAISTLEPEVKSVWRLTSQREVEVWDVKNQEHPPRISWDPKDTWLQKIEIIPYRDCHNVAWRDIAPLFDQQIQQSMGTFIEPGIWEMNPSLVGYLGDHGIYFLRVTAKDGTWHMSEKPVYTIIDDRLTPEGIVELKKSLAECIFIDSPANQQAYKEYAEYWEKKKMKSSPSGSATPASPVLVAPENDRNKAADARIKSDISQFRILAETIYDNNSSKYDSVADCFTATTPAAANCKGTETSVNSLQTDLTSANGVADPGLASVDSATAYCVSAVLKSDATQYFCVDSTGIAKVSRAACSTTACP